MRIDRVTAVRRHAGSGAEIVVDGGAVLPVSRRRRGMLAMLFGG